MTQTPGDDRETIQVVEERAVVRKRKKLTGGVRVRVVEAIPPHVGVTNSRLVCHLPLIVPDGCWFRVGAETRHWHPGEAFVFDDTIEHEAMNPSNELRIVFIFDIWHPDLSTVEREAVTALIEAEEGTGIPL